MKNKFFAALVLTIACTQFIAFGQEKVHEHGYWLGDLPDHAFDPKLAQALIGFFKNENAQSIVDFGCGRAEYIKLLMTVPIYCEGYDGNPETFAMSGGVAQALDLSAPVDLGKDFDWVLSLEVAEHLPKKFEQIFIENLNRHNTNGIVLSWAVKDQGGLGHFNEQNNDYVKAIMSHYGYFNDIAAEKQLREASSLPWFKNTIMVFRKMHNI